MKLLEDIFKKIILNESVDVSEVEDAIDNHERVIINYHTKGEDKNTGARVAEVYAYGLTAAGNPCIRVFQPYGDTTTHVPDWKLMRLDRISGWEKTGQKFNRPADFYYKNIGKFNPNGDETMSVVYKIAKFGDEQQTANRTPDGPKTKQDVYKTDSETRMERLRQQVANPIKLSDIKYNDAFKQLDKDNKQTTTTDRPKTNQDVYKTSTEAKPMPTEKSPEEKQRQLDKLRSVLSDKPISLSDLNKRMKQEPQQTKWQDIFNDEVENDLQQMQKNDRTNQRRRDRRWEKAADTRALNRKGSLNRENFQ